MKINIKFICMLAFCAFTTFGASAHGGVSKNVGNAIVFLNQQPISPLVGEKVLMTFALTDKNLRALPNTDLTLTLTDTFLGDASKDKIIFTKHYTTDTNSNFHFEYTFEKENYFDVEVAFKDPVTRQMDITGFLIQPRAFSWELASDYQLIWPMAVAVVGVFIVGYVLGIME